MIFEAEDDRRSVLTPGGSPATDAAYLAWRRRFEAEVNSRWLDARTRFGEELPDREPLDGWACDEWVFLRTGGNRLFDDFNYAHRLRHLSVLFATRRRKVIQLCERYAARRLKTIEARR